MKTILKLAREAGMAGMLTDIVCTLTELERFAALIRADEREACAELCEQFTRTPETNGLELTLCAEEIRARGEQT